MKDIINTLLRTLEQGVIDQNYKGSFFEGRIALYVTFLVGIAILAYLIGSANFGIIISKAKGNDIRNYGSGNAGATNISRVFGMKTAILTFICDSLKTAIATLVGIVLVGSLGGFIAGFFTIVGHAFPAYFKFRGGKGIACLATLVFLTSPICFFVLLAIYLVLLFGFKMVSFASIMTTIIYPFMLSMINGYGLQIIVALAISLLVVFLHRENIVRIFNHEEPKINIGKKKNQAKGIHYENGEE